jgi:integrase
LTGFLKDPKKAILLLKNRMNVNDFAMHDLRRTLGSYMAIGGASFPIIGKALNHKSQISTAIYARLSQARVLDAINMAVGLIQNNGLVELFKINGGLTRADNVPLHFSELLLIK